MNSRWWICLIGLSAAGLVATGCSGKSPHSGKSVQPPSSKSSTATTSPLAGSGGPSGSRAFEVTSYDGCQSNGSTNCHQGLQDAVNAAQAAGGGTVYLPAGTYLDDSLTAVMVPPGPGITIEGAGQSTTRIIKSAPYRHPTILSVKAAHVIVSGLTFNASKVGGGGAVVLVTSSYTTVENAEIIGGPDTAWPLRFAGGSGTATPRDSTYMTGNAVDNVTVDDDAPRADDGLDFPFQEDGTINNVQEMGSRLGLYVDKNVIVTNYHYTPNPAVAPSGAYGFI